MVVVDFDTLEHALGALNSQALHGLRATSEELRPMHYPFEYREV